MSYQVAILKNSTGEIRLCDFDLELGDNDEYWFLEGNYSCDCNRGLSFERARGNYDHEHKCGESEYTALYALVNGEKILLEQNS
ncbi:hypothetical protein [Caudoviricetes sp.]|nr:hypothetical protein [Caudoviricetes sp.]